MRLTTLLLPIINALVAPAPTPSPPSAATPPTSSPSPPTEESAPSENAPAPVPTEPDVAKQAAVEVKPTRDPERKVSFEPAPVLPPPPRLTFDVDPLADGSIIAMALSFGFVLDAINSTGEIRPQQIASDFDRSQLLAIDRSSLSRAPNDAAAARANLGLFVSVGFALADPILSGWRERSVQTAMVDAFMYAESMSLTFALTDITKVAVRRPRPLAYAEA